MKVLKFIGLEYFASFELEQVEEGTRVTWTYDGDVSGTEMMNVAVGKPVGMFMDKMIGPSYEEGLVSLKNVVENKPEPETETETAVTDSTSVKQ